MATKKTATSSQARRGEKKGNNKQAMLYTYSVSVTFAMQFTFEAHDVHPAEEGGEHDVDPTDQALQDLEHEIKEYLSQQYVIEGMEAYADFDDLLGVGPKLRLQAPLVDGASAAKKKRTKHPQTPRSSIDRK